MRGFALAAMTAAGFGFANQDQGPTFEVARSSATPGAPSRFVIEGYMPHISVRAASLRTKALGFAEASTPATLRVAGQEPFHVVLDPVDPEILLDLTVQTRACAATRFSTSEVANPLFRTDTTYTRDVEITCAGGGLVFLARQATLRHSDPASAKRAVAFGQGITLTRSEPGGRITVKADFLTFGVDRR